MEELLAALREVARLVEEGVTGDALSNAVFDRDYNAYKIQTFLTSAGDLSQTESDLLDQASDVVDAIPSEEFGDIADAVEDTLNNLNDNAPEYEAYRQRLSAEPEGAPRAGRTPPPPESSGSRPRAVVQPAATRTATPPVVPPQTPPRVPPVATPTPPVTPPVAPASVFTPPPEQPRLSPGEELRQRVEARTAATRGAAEEAAETARVASLGQEQGRTAGNASRRAGSEARRLANPRADAQAAFGQGQTSARRASATLETLAAEVEATRVADAEALGATNRARFEAEREARITEASRVRAQADTDAARLRERIASSQARNAANPNASRFAREGGERSAARTAAGNAARQAEERNAARLAADERARTNRPDLEATRATAQATRAEAARVAALTPQQRDEELRAANNQRRRTRADEEFDRKYNTRKDGTIRKDTDSGYVFRDTVKRKEMRAARLLKAQEQARSEAGTAAGAARRAAAEAARAAEEATREAARPLSRRRRLTREAARVGRQLRQPATIPLVGPALEVAGTAGRAVGRGALRTPFLGPVVESVITSPTANRVASGTGAILRHPATRLAGTVGASATLIYDVIQQGGLTYDSLLSSEQQLDFPTVFGGSTIPAGQNVVAIDPRSDALFAALTALEFTELEDGKPRFLDDYTVLRGDPAQLAQLEEYFPVEELNATLYGGEKRANGEIVFVEQDIPHPDGGEISQLTNLHTQFGEREGLIGYLGGSDIAQFFARNVSRLSPDLRFVSNGLTLNARETAAFELEEEQALYDTEIANADAERLGIQNGNPLSQDPNNPARLQDFTQQTTPAVQPPPAVTGIPEIDQAIADGTTGDPQLDAAIEQVLRGEALQGPQGNPAGPQPIQRQGPTGSPAQRQGPTGNPAPQGGAQLQQGPTGVPELDQALAQLQGSEAGSTGIPELDQAITQLQNSEAGVTGIPELDQALGGQQTPQQSSQVPQQAPQQQVQQGQQAPQGQNEQLVNRILEQFPGLQTPQLQDAGGGIQTLIDTLSQPIEVGAFDQREGFQGPPDLQQEDVGALRRGSRVGSLVDSADPNLTTAQALLGLLQDYTQDPVADRRSAIAEEQRAFGNERRTAELTEFARVQGLGLEANANRERSLGQAVDAQSRAIGTRNANEISRVRDLNTSASNIFFAGEEALRRAQDSDSGRANADRTFLQTDRNEDRSFAQGERELDLRAQGLRDAAIDRALDREQRALAADALADYNNGRLSILQYNARVEAIRNRPVAGPR